MKTVKVTGTTAAKVIWTPFGNHTVPGIPVVVTLLTDDNGLPESVADVETAPTAGPIAG